MVGDPITEDSPGDGEKMRVMAWGFRLPQSRLMDDFENFVSSSKEKVLRNSENI